MKQYKYKTCSVVMAVYKNDKPAWVTKSIESLLSQTTKSNDIVIVRDGQVPNRIEKILEKFERDPNLTIIRLDSNIGAGPARNLGIKATKNDLVAIMDADDISMPKRFELQLARFNKDSSLTIVGGQIAEFVDKPSNVVSYRKVPLEHRDIKKFAKRRSPFNNISVCIKRKVFIDLGGYEKINRAEDYSLWLKLLTSNYKTANCPEVLCSVRINKASIKRRVTWDQTKQLIKLRWKYRRFIGLVNMFFVDTAQLLLLLFPAQFVNFVYKIGLRK